MKYRVCGKREAGDKSSTTKPFFEIYL